LFDVMAPDLTLDGLRLLADRNALLPISNSPEGM
ncbi:MAG: pantothenate kinase, partial [Gluconobacter sp.]